MLLIRRYIWGKPTILYISGLFILTPTTLSLRFWNTQWRRIACLTSKLLKTTTTKPYPLFWLPPCPWVFLNLLSQEENKAWRATVPLYTIACWKGILLSQGDAEALETEFWLTWWNCHSFSFSRIKLAPFSLLTNTGWRFSQWWMDQIRVCCGVECWWETCIYTMIIAFNRISRLSGRRKYRNGKWQWTSSLLLLQLQQINRHLHLDETIWDSVER